MRALLLSRDTNNPKEVLAGLSPAAPQWAFMVVCLTFLTVAPMVAGVQDTIQTDVPALKEVFARDFHVGCLLSYTHIGFPTDPYVNGQSNVVEPNGGYLIQYHMNSMGPGNNMKPQYTVDMNGSLSAYNAAVTQAEKDSINIHPVVRFNGNLIAQLNWAQRQGFRMRGHTLVWHNQTPGTGFFRVGYAAAGTYLTREVMTSRMENYIKEVIRLLHEGWPGLLLAMDVVNEAVNDGTGTDRTTGNEWYTTFGDISYIAKAFEFTRKYTVQYGETQMKLYYNDYNTHDPNKANGIVRICSPIFRAGHLDGIGMQEHDGTSSPTAAQWKASYAKFDTVCTEMAVTEFDVTTPSFTSEGLATQANQVGALLKCFVEKSYRSGRGKVVNFTKDGLNDRWTFKTNSSFWDSTNQCKPSFYAAVAVGINYDALDSLIACADTLEEGRYTPASWAAMVSALASATAAMAADYSASVSAADALGQARDSLQAALEGLMLLTQGVAAKETAPAFFALLQNYPNPFNPTTMISWQLPVTSRSRLAVYDMLGREVAVLVDEQQAPGRHSMTWNASGLASGTYLYRLTAGTSVASKTMLLVK